jgi:betaine-aldehyde dehydrogenase
MQNPLYQRDLYVDGTFVPASGGRTLNRHSPADGSWVGQFAWATPHDVEQAILVARRAFDHGPWPRTPGAERALVLLQAAHLLQERREAFALAECHTSAAPLEQCRWMVDWVVDLLRYYAGLARSIAGKTVDFGPGQLGLTLEEPLGVVSLIVPWNFPLNQAAWKIVPALAAGCTMIVKPDSKTPVTTLDLAALLTEAGLPAGVINVVVAEPAETGPLFTSHPAIDMVSLTGSTATGKVVMAQAAATLKRLNLELGGKSPNIVFADANLDQAATSAAWGVFFRCGQICTAGSRILVQAEVYDLFLDKLKAVAAGMSLGHPLHSQASLGPLISPQHLERVDGYVQQAVAQGAQLELGGQPLQGGEFDQGCYYPPTILGGVQPSMTIAQEEVFGPVTALIPFGDEREALELANQTIYGLASAVWTHQFDRALFMARGLKAGTVWVNNYGVVKAEMPVGGYKMSGFGRELGEASLRDYLQSKSVHLSLNLPT